MSNSILFHTQGIRGFDHQRWNWDGGTATAHIVRQPGRFRCPSCGAADVTPTEVGERTVRGLPLGIKPLDLVVRMHRLKCHECAAFRMEQLEFLPSSHAHITRALQRTVVELRPHMSISAVAEHFGLDWKTVKNAEKDHLKRKYSSISLGDVKTIGIDEIHIGRKRYKTVVRDLNSGAVLHVGDGRGADALKPFGRSLHSSGAQIETVAMDMAAGYGAWAREALPETVIVYDHFHVIKLMNEKIDAVRRRIVRDMDEHQTALLKKKRFLLLRNEEDLDEEAAQQLAELREVYSDLGTASMLKESLRGIYRNTEHPHQAERILSNWCMVADLSGIPEMKTMARTIRQHSEGVLAFWTHHGLTSASMEGFNNKIRWLIRQAYGYRDEEYFRLKIFDLPNVKTERDL